MSHLPSLMTIRCAGLLIAHWGKASTSDLIDIAHRRGVTGSRPAADGKTGSKGSRAADLVRRSMRPLRDEGLVTREGDEWVASNLADLAAYLADAMDEYQDHLDAKGGHHE